METFFDLIVKPLTTTTSENLLAVFFEEVKFTGSDETEDPDSLLHPLDDREQKNRLLQQELTDTREYLQAIIEELKSSNEEMQSMNEELQSVNEELETSQEELKAVNEEMLTTNSELERKVEEVTWANNDLENTLNTIQTGIILLDAGYSVRRFNPAAAEVFKLIPGDVGRPITHIVSDLDYRRLREDLEKVFATLVPHEVDIQSKKGRWYSLQMRPYRTVQNAIKGIVIAFNDVTAQRRTEAIEAARLLGENVFNSVREPLILIDANLQVINANESFFKIMNVTAEETLELPLSALGDGAWNIPELVALIKAVFENNTVLEDYEVTLKLPSLGLRKILVNARQIQAGESQQPRLVLLALESEIL
ncbi:MAG: PAS domain-containing protein [Chloroflexi bacterium]|nr:PAS domain-containing protein [Chloroflexota bacterium]